MYRIIYFVAGVNTHVEVLRETNIVSDDLRPAHIARLAIGFNGLFGVRVILMPASLVSSAVPPRVLEFVCAACSCDKYS